jgi:tetratricopeptide (TPR) repeat protein
MPQAMSDDEWFRSPSWREEDRELFEAKLARAQKRNRAQYMRIKALSLAESGDKAAHAEAGELFERIFGEYPDDELQVTMAHADKARWHRQRGEQGQAVEHYRRAVALEDALGSIDWGADLDLAELLVERNEHLDEAQTMLDRAAARGLAFKSQRWRWLVTDARLAAKVGQRDRYMASAGAALRLLDDDNPDFPRHPNVGHIDTDRGTIREVKRLAAGR